MPLDSSLPERPSLPILEPGTLVVYWGREIVTVLEDRGSIISIQFQNGEKIHTFVRKIDMLTPEFAAILLAR